MNSLLVCNLRLYVCKNHTASIWICLVFVKKNAPLSEREWYQSLSFPPATLTPSSRYFQQLPRQLGLRPLSLLAPFKNTNKNAVSKWKWSQVGSRVVATDSMMTTMTTTTPWRPSLDHLRFEQESQKLASLFQHFSTFVRQLWKTITNRLSTNKSSTNQRLLLLIAGKFKHPLNSQTEPKLSQC